MNIAWNQASEGLKRAVKPFVVFYGIVGELILGWIIWKAISRRDYSEAIDVLVIFVGIGVVLVHRAWLALPAFIKSVKKLPSILTGLLAILAIGGLSIVFIGLVIWAICGFFIGLAAMSTTTFLLLIIIWLLISKR